LSASHLPKISGVPGTLAIGASLISFEKSSPAYSSYGYEKSYNAPVSFQAVEGYTYALNYLLVEEKHYLKIGNTKLLFWAGTSEDATDLIAELLEKPDELTIKDFLAKAKTGVFATKLKYDDRVFSVILGGNSGRVVVRHWLQIPLKEFIENVESWYEDLELIKFRSHEKDKMPPLHHFRLAVATVRETKDLKDEVSTQILRGIFHGHTPSVNLIGNLVNRVAVDLSNNGKSSLGNLSRFSLLRLIVNRNLRKENISMEIKPTLEQSIVQPDLVVDYPYQCGRLLAVFEELQAAYHDYKLEGPSVVERYYGTASTSPNSAFGILWRLHTHHLRKVARTNGDKGKAKATAIKNKIAGITKHFQRKNPSDLTSPPEFPRSFSSQEQGRFALGFYQQIAADKDAYEAYLQNKKLEENKGEEN
jgi:CRISPR-associated protein Csd1